MKHTTYTAEYKIKLILEILREETQISQIASREGISRTQLQNWKKEFLENATMVFSRSKREQQLKAEKREIEQRENALAKKVGILSIENDFLKKKYKQIHGKDYDGQQ